MKRDGGTGKMIEVHCSPLGSPGTPLVGPNRGLAWNQTLTYISQVTRFKTWQKQSQHMTPTMSRNGSYLLPPN